MGDRTRPFRARDPSGIRLLPCVWMSAGLVAYKLCDRDLDCEGCPFDEAMRGAARKMAHVEARTRQTPPWRFPADRRYHPGHTWAAELAAGQVRTGLDAFAARLVGHAGSVVLPAVGSRVRQGRVACWLLDGGELLPVRAPVSGTVLRLNPWIRSQPGILVGSPYEAGWLVELAEVDPAEMRNLLPAEEMRARAERELERLERKVKRYVSRGHAEVGPTLADGGKKLADLREILGPVRYRRLVESFLR